MRSSTRISKLICRTTLQRKSIAISVLLLLTVIACQQVWGMMLPPGVNFDTSTSELANYQRRLSQQVSQGVHTIADRTGLDKDAASRLSTRLHLWYYNHKRLVLSDDDEVPQQRYLALSSDLDSIVDLSKMAIDQSLTTDHLNEFSLVKSSYLAQIQAIIDSE